MGCPSRRGDGGFSGIGGDGAPEQRREGRAGFSGIPRDGWTQAAAEGPWGMRSSAGSRGSRRLAGSAGSAGRADPPEASAEGGKAPRGAQAGPALGAGRARVRSPRSPRQTPAAGNAPCSFLGSLAVPTCAREHGATPLILDS